ncbi:MAG TPA: ubiquinol-cytochrome c reductase iron-sulfur subunit [Candidatus Hypogeohydataceae bacterium YC41]
METKATNMEEKTGAVEAVPVKEDTGLAEGSRRSFLLKLGWAGFALFQVTWIVSFMRFFFPRCLFEPPMTFKAGFPWEYTIGSVSTRWQKEYRVWVVRESEGFYALFGQCTHLGCTPVWWEGENKFKCPCHGSGFTKEGINYEGPAPRPLERVKIALAADGQLLVDKSVRFRQERGEWEKPGAFLKV